jgi:hypothetical protein
VTGQQTTTSHLKGQLTAYDVLVVLGHKQPQRGNAREFYMEVAELARQVPQGFQLTPDQRRQLRAIDASPDALTHQVDPQIREPWTIAMFTLAGAPQFGSSQTIKAVSDTVIATGRDICERYGISLQAASTGLREASAALASSGSQR